VLTNVSYTLFITTELCLYVSLDTEYMTAVTLFQASLLSTHTTVLWLPVPEETFTHLHLSWSSIVPYLLHPSTTIRGILPVQSMHLTVFFLSSTEHYYNNHFMAIVQVNLYYPVHWKTGGFCWSFSMVLAPAVCNLLHDCCQWADLVSSFKHKLTCNCLK